MTSDLRVPLPEELEPFRADLEFFFATMVRKLHTNRHKGTEKDLVPSKMLNMATEEMGEAWRALREEGQFEFAVECCDIANFAFLASRGAWHMTRDSYDRQRTVPPGEAIILETALKEGFVIEGEYRRMKNERP